MLDIVSWQEVRRYGLFDFWTRHLSGNTLGIPMHGEKVARLPDGLDSIYNFRDPGFEMWKTEKEHKMYNIKVRKSRQTDLIAETAERSVSSAYDRTTIQAVMTRRAGLEDIR